MARRFSNLWAYLLVCIELPLAMLPGNELRKKRITKDADEIVIDVSVDSPEILVVESESEESKPSFLGQIIAVIEDIGSLFIK